MTRPARVLVTGSRTWNDEQMVADALLEAWNDALQDGAPGIIVVHGACPRGADAIADRWARSAGIQVEDHPAQNHPSQDFGPWPGAGPHRNAYMIDLGADIALAFIGPCENPRCPRTRPHPSHGAAGCAGLAKAAGIPVRRYTA